METRMKKRISKSMNRMKILNSPSPVTKNGVNKFWNFVDRGKIAELNLFGTISSEEDWWSDDCVTYRNFISELNALGDKDEINVMIHSCGGDVFAANAIYSALLMNKAKITGTIIGLCASAATIVLMACDTRKIAKNAILMAHNPTITVRGSYEADELIKLAEVTQQVKQSIIQAYMERLDKTEDEISQLMDEETWYVGQEAVDAGFCDEIVDTSVQNNLFSNKNMFMVNGNSYNFTNYMEKVVPDEVRKKVQDLSGTFFNTTNTTKSKKGTKNMDEMGQETVQTIQNAEQLRAAYPELCQQMIEDAVNTERERMKAIDEIASGISQDIVDKAKYTEPLSAAELALAAMKANNIAGQKEMQNIVSDLTGSGAGDVVADPNAGADTVADAKAKSEQKISAFANALKKDKRRGK